jgi:cytochrome P450
MIPANRIIYVAITAANRDPSRWENPETFDPHRPSKAHLSFSAGPHTCIGMHLGKREIAILLDRLATRLPRLRLDPDRPPPKIEGWMLRSVTRLPVVVDKA